MLISPACVSFAPRLEYIIGQAAPNMLSGSPSEIKAMYININRRVDVIEQNCTYVVKKKKAFTIFSSFLCYSFTCEGLMKRFSIYILIITLVMFSFSCKKKGVEENATPVVDEIQRDNATSIEKHLETVVSSSDVSEKTSLTLTELIAENETNKDEADFILNEIYRGGAILIRAEFEREKGTLSFNIENDEIKEIIKRVENEFPKLKETVSYTLVDKQIDLTYPPTDEITIDTMWVSFKALLNDYNKEKSNEIIENEPGQLIVEKEDETVIGVIDAIIYGDKLTISIPKTISSSDLDSFITNLVEKYPSLVTYGEYTEKDGVVTLTYAPSFTLKDASSLWPLLIDEINSFFTEEKEVIVEENSERKEEKVSSKTSEFIKKYSVTLSMNNSYDTAYSYVPLINLGFDYSFNSKFSLGAKLSYDFSGYIPLSIGGKYYLIDETLYLALDAGVKFGVRENKGRLGFISSINVGYEMPLSDSISIIGEASAIYTYDKTSHFRFGLTVGGKYSF